MKPRKSVAVAALGAVLMAAPDSFAATMDFDSVPLGTRYGGTVGHATNEVVLTQDGIEMSVGNLFLAEFTGFFEAEVGGRYLDFFPTTPLDINNISVHFDFSNVGFEVDRMTMEFIEFGGEYNFAVNDQTIYELASLADIPENVAPDVTALVSNGVITLTGDVGAVRIGGQELAIDTVFAIPEPVTLLLLSLGGAAVLGSRKSPWQWKAATRSF